MEMVRVQELFLHSSSLPLSIQAEDSCNLRWCHEAELHGRSSKQRFSQAKSSKIGGTPGIPGTDLERQSKATKHLSGQPMRSKSSAKARDTETPKLWPHSKRPGSKGCKHSNNLVTEASLSTSSTGSTLWKLANSAT